MVNNATNIWKNEQFLTSKKTLTYDIENPDTALGQVQKCVDFGQKTILLRKKTTMQFYCQNTIRSLKDTKLCLPYTCWKMEVGITTFLKFLLAKSSFLCRFRVESVNIFVLLRFELSTCSSINKQFTKFAHASGRMNIACVNNEILLDTLVSFNGRIVFWQ
jgi:hypothetical protein